MNNDSLIYKKKISETCMKEEEKQLLTEYLCIKPNTDLLDKYTFIFLRMIRGDLNLEITDKLVNTLQKDFIKNGKASEKKTSKENTSEKNIAQGEKNKEYQKKEKENDPNFNNIKNKNKLDDRKLQKDNSSNFNSRFSCLFKKECKTNSRRTDLHHYHKENPEKSNYSLQSGNKF